MKKTIRFALRLLALLLTAGAGLAAFVAVRGVPHYPVPVVAPAPDFAATPTRLALGQQLVLTACADCHLNPATGRLTGQRLVDVPPEFGTIYAANITQDAAHGIGCWTDAQLLALLRTGIGPDGRFRVIMPSYGLMSDEDVASIGAFLRSNHAWTRAYPAVAVTPAQRPSWLLKALAHTVMVPAPLPTRAVRAPALADSGAYGRYLVVGRYKCYECHSADFKTNNALVPEQSAGYLGGGNALLDRQQHVVRSPNLTPDPATGLGNWAFADFDRALRYGLAPHGPLRYPMPKYSTLPAAEVRALWAYLRTVPGLASASPPSRICFMRRVSEKERGD